MGVGVLALGAEESLARRSNLIQTLSVNWIPVLNADNEKKLGGDWKGGFFGLGVEEILARVACRVESVNIVYYFISVTRFPRYFTF
jgi:hypothetical protein